MRAAPEIHVEWVDDEAVALNPETGQLHYLNPPAALAYALIAELGLEEGLLQLRERAQIPPEAEGELQVLIDEFLDKGLLLHD